MDILELEKIMKENNMTDISRVGLYGLSYKENVDDPNTVKCVKDKNGFALYFSRSKIPFERNEGIAKFYKHIGIYGYKRESLFKMTKFTSDEAVYRFAKKLRRMGIDDKLIEMGAKEGDQVRILDFYFDFKD